MESTQALTDHVSNHFKMPSLATRGSQIYEQTLTSKPHENETRNAELLKKLTWILRACCFFAQDETNQWLRKMRWSLTCIFIIIILWHLFGWRIIPIR